MTLPFLCISKNTLLNAALRRTGITFTLVQGTAVCGHYLQQRTCMHINDHGINMTLDKQNTTLYWLYEVNDCFKKVVL